jgi:hypothetical protein
MWVMQAHHIDTGHYDPFFDLCAYGPTHAAQRRPGTGDFGVHVIEVSRGSVTRVS